MGNYQLLNLRNKLFLFKGKFGNRPVSPTNSIKFVWYLAVDIFAVTNFHYTDREFAILDRIYDAISALANTIVFLVR